MRITVSVSLETATATAATEIVRSAIDDLGGQRADVAFLFVSRHHADDAEEALRIVSETLGARHVVGCTAESVLCGADEHLDRPALSLFAASMPGVEIDSFELPWPQDDSDVAKEALRGRVPADAETLVLFGDPYTFPAEAFVREMGASRPDVCIVGGMASSARSIGENRLFVGARALSSGAVALTFSGGVEVRSVVSQGCRSFGKPLVITRCEDNVIHELGGRPALERFTEQVSELTDGEREVLANGLHIGRAVDSGRASDGDGEFLIRGVLGFVKENGSMVIGDDAVRGQTIQFHLRDPGSASDELRRLLARAHERLDGDAAGALVFTCNGRGTRMFETPSHDARAIRERFGELPVAGFFAAGEIGPVGSESFLHGFTAVTVLFRGR